jgi:Ca2+-binding EF-hand superfamily protein
MFEAAFAEADTNGNGTIEKSELEKHLKEINYSAVLKSDAPAPEFNEDFVSKVLTEMDANGDGILQRDEYKVLIRKFTEGVLADLQR